jgi:post-segregation antitoxin (ccd killing protein)
MRVGLGWKAHSGWAALVALGGDSREPHLIERSRIELAAAVDAEWAKQPYHAAEGLEPEDASEVVERGVTAAHRMAADAMRAARTRCAAGSEDCGCAVLVGRGMPSWTVHEILAVHFRMHQAEGELFRDALVAGARACGLALTTLPDKSVLDAAARALGISRARLDGALAALGKAAGSPWGKDQKEAAAAALVAIEGTEATARREARPRG